MSTALDEDLDRLDKDSRWLHSQYVELINKFNEEYVAIKNEDVLTHDKNLENFKTKLKEEGLKPSEVLIEYIRDKRNRLT
jgi:hypothetical protein